MNFELFINSIIFLLASLIVFSIPGIFLLHKIKPRLSSSEKIILGTTIGYTLFTLLAYLLLILKLSYLLLPIVLIIDIFAISPIKSMIKNFIPPTKTQSLTIIIIFLIGIIGQMLIIAPSGMLQNGDLVFWSAHGHDGPWHIALMEEIKKGYPLQNPTYAGEKLVNYHFFSDIAPAEFSRYLPISNINLYFRFFPLLFSIILGCLSFLLGQKIGQSFKAGLWAVFFTYFAGSFGYILTFIQNKTIAGESIFWATQIQSSIGNPPQIVSFIILLAILYLLSIFLKQKDYLLAAIIILLSGSLIVFKVYAGIILLGALLITSCWQVIRERHFHLLILTIISCILSLFLYLPNTAGSTTFLIFEPWWFIRTMVVAPNRLDWLDLELKRQTYVAEHNWKRVFQVEMTAFLIFVFGNLGMRFIGLIKLWVIIKELFNNYFSSIIFWIIIISFIAPLLFLQKGVASNTIQFLQYFLLIFGILAGISLDLLLTKIKNKILSIIVVILVILFSIPTQIGLIYDFYSRAPFAKIDQDELTALQFLKENSLPSSVILTPDSQKLDTISGIPPIWAWFDTAYVPAFSARRVYLSDKEQVDIMGYQLDDRLKIQKAVFQEKDPQIFFNFLKNNQINYLYFPKILKPEIDLNKLNLTKIYSNSKTEIWQIN